MVDLGRAALVAFALIYLTAGAAFARAEAETQPAGVREFMTAQTTARPGVQMVEGVVSRVLPDSHQLALIDVAEFRECEVVTCAKLTLPVRWRGPLPEVSSVVRVTGTVEQEGIRRIFAASDLEVVRPPRGVLE